MKNIAAFLILSAVVFTFSGCNLFSEDENCGPHFVNTSDGDGIDIKFWETFVSGYDRIYRKTLKVENVCAAEHVTANFTMEFDADGDITTLDNLNLPVSVRGWIEYNPLFPNEEDITATGQTQGFFLTGDVEAGLAQVYGEDPAIYWVSLEISFATTGVEAQDDAYVQGIVSNWTMETSYFEYK